MKGHALIGPAGFFVLWWIVANVVSIDSFFVPDPFVVIKELFSLLYNGAIFFDVYATLRRLIFAFIFSIIFGIPLGLFLGSSKKVYTSMGFIIDFFRSTPPIALFPLFLLIFGIQDITKIAITVFAGILVIMFNTAQGVIHERKSRLIVAKSMGATKIQTFFFVSFWESLPQTFIGLRNAISLSLMVVIVTEMFIGTNFGLGRRIVDAQVTYEIKTMYAVIILIGGVGYLLNLLFSFLERKIIHWKGW